MTKFDETLCYNDEIFSTFTAMLLEALKMTILQKQKNVIFKPNLVPKTPHETYSETSDLDETLHGRSWRKNLEFETYRNRFNLDLTPFLTKI